MNKETVMKSKTIKAENSEHLAKLMIDEIEIHGYNVDLNHIDVSNITDMNCLFFNSDFNGNISKWDVSNVEDMAYMFYSSRFNGDISHWNVKNVKNMHRMFQYSSFNKNIGSWDVSNVENMQYMFCKTPFQHDLSDWTPYKAVIKDIFEECRNINKPYWSNYQDIHERVKAIELNVMKFQLEKDLENNLNNKKRVKI